MKNNHNLIWIDLEMTGLEPERDRIIELATLVTDAHLNILAEGPVFAIHQDNALLDSMDDWNTKQHNQSGLVKRVQESQVTEKEAESLTIAFLSQYVDKGKSPMCGNSICQDRRFLYKYMPELAAFFHYRNLDVSTLKELAARWHPKVLSGISKQSKHLALEDIKDSINELRHYREHFIHLPDTANTSSAANPQQSS
ncbi:MULTISPECIES: oligoribonuclease [Legionella]|uniref:Oligoribonuclease n=1 Tax=Legionella septentrionalis TaxID=2498109 RepID=A0A433JLM5_9GAMM|nr:MULTISPECIES: oligoribonuclease [Legionella]MCP0913893.1 oligoribonuclease [Legionella sp. 27cVA30]RUQ90438.1 oligoribonuclease [Legionella septentrionalis]RUQ94681.1 oligoribonuclease [Legionella septentrionalis]RUR10784.1 oligoribonuclease [Legionella septentrionalis]RUR16462.1 oligoribonuclease [Legionella septentrionalis]